MLKDMDSGAILFERGTDKRFAPASMAKVMTAYVVLDLIDSGKLTRDAVFTVDRDTWKKWNGSNGGSTMFLRPGEKVSVDARSEEHTMELQSPMRILYAVFCFTK